MRLTDIATGATAIKWFPDGKRIAFVSWVWPDLAERDGAGEARQGAQGREGQGAPDRARRIPFLGSLADRRPRAARVRLRRRDRAAATTCSPGPGCALQPWDPAAELYDISPDGRELALTIDPAPEPGLMNRCDLVVVDIKTRRAKNLTTDSGLSDEHPLYSPDGKSLAYHAYDTARAFNDQGQLRILDRKTGRFDASSRRRSIARRRTCAGRPIRRRCCRSPRIVGASAFGGIRHRATVPHAALSGRHDFRIRRVRRRQHAGVHARNGAPSAGAVRLPTGDGTGERQIESQNRALLARHALGDVREFTIEGWHGEPVQMFVTYPPGFDRKRKWPLMHSIHGGPHAAHHDCWHFRWNTQVFAAQGYVVAAVNYHGSSGFGQKFLETITGRYGEKEFADTEAGTDFLLRAGLHRSRRA